MDLLHIFGNTYLWAATISMAVPLALPAIGGTYSERSGVVNISMEGIMLISAFTSVSFSAYFHNAWLGLLMGILSGLIVSGIFAWAAARMYANQVVLGMAFNIFASGITAYLFNAIYGPMGTPSDTPKIPDVKIPLIDSIPFIGKILSEQNALVYIMFALLIFSQWFLFKTTLGLRIRAVGENPEAAETAGIDVVKMKYIGVMLGGIFSAIGGAYLSIGILNGFSPEMSSGRGYIALAAMIFGKWTPVGAFLASLLFGFSTALSYSLQELTI